MSKKKLIFLILLALVVIGFSGQYLLKRFGVVSDTLTLYGNVELRQVALAFNGSDRIAALHVQEGDLVKAGQILGELDTHLLKLRVAQAEAQTRVHEQVLKRLQTGSRPEELSQAKANTTAVQAEAQQARQTLERLQNIDRNTAGRGVSQQDLETAQARFKVAEAQLARAQSAEQLAVIGAAREDIAGAHARVEAARAELALLDQQLADAQLKSPVDAIVRSRLMEPGEMTSPQRPVFNLAINSPKWVRAYVSEVDLGHVKSGQAAQVFIDSFPDQPLTARVGYISSVAEFTPKTVQTEDLRTSLVYEIRVLVEDPRDVLRLGMPATVTLVRDAAATTP